MTNFLAEPVFSPQQCVAPIALPILYLIMHYPQVDALASPIVSHQQGSASITSFIIILTTYCPQVDALAVPIVIHRDDLEAIAPLWLSITEQIRKDKATWDPAWNHERYACLCPDWCLVV